MMKKSKKMGMSGSMKKKPMMEEKDMMMKMPMHDEMHGKAKKKRGKK